MISTREINTFKKILVAVDSSDQSMKAVDVGISLAKQYGSILTALCVIHMPFGETLSSHSLWYKDLIDDIIEETSKWVADIAITRMQNNIKIESIVKETTESLPAEIVRYTKARLTLSSWNQGDDRCLTSYLW